VTILRHGVNTLKLFFEATGPLGFRSTTADLVRLFADEGIKALEKAGEVSVKRLHSATKFQWAAQAPPLAGRSGSSFPRFSPDFGPSGIASSHVPVEHGKLCSATASAGRMLSFATDATARSSPRHGRDTLQKLLQEEKGPLETDLPVSPSSCDLIDLECAASPGTSNGRFFQCQ